LKDEVSAVRYAAAKALERQGGPQALAALTAAVKDKSWGVHWTALKAVEKMRQPREKPKR